MAIFCRKNLETSPRVGERLKKARENEYLNLEDVSAKTRIPLKYLEAIESSRWSDLPLANAHRLAYVREYARALNLNPDSFLYQFSHEADPENCGMIHPRTQLKIWRFGSLSYILRNAALAAFVLGFLAYLVWQINGILQPPKLTIFAPEDGSVSNRLSTMVQGETEKEVRLTVNGKEIMANDRGRFEAEVDLSNGVNTITISAIKKHGKTTTITKYIVVKPNTAKNIGVN